VATADEALVKVDLANDDAKVTALQLRDYLFVSRSGVVASPNDLPLRPPSLIVASAVTPSHTASVNPR